jgi:hypothetical protein
MVVDSTSEYGLNADHDGRGVFPLFDTLCDVPRGTEPSLGLYIQHIIAAAYEPFVSPMSQDYDLKLFKVYQLAGNTTTGGLLSSPGPLLLLALIICALYAI